MDISHQKNHLDESWESYFEFGGANPSVSQIKNSIDEQTRLTIGHLYRIEQLLFSKNRNQRNEVQAEMIMQDLMENLELLTKKVPDCIKIETVAKNLNFILDQGVETIDYVQSLL